MLNALSSVMNFVESKGPVVDDGTVVDAYGQSPVDSKVLAVVFSVINMG